MNPLKSVLIEQNKNEKWLAYKLGISELEIMAYCNSIIEPSLNLLFKMAIILNVEASRLYKSNYVP